MRASWDRDPSISLSHVPSQRRVPSQGIQGKALRRTLPCSPSRAVVDCLCAHRCVDVLELCEQEDLMHFHYHTLRLYSAVCALGNSRVAYALCGHVDLSQLFYAIDNKYLPGLLRSGFYDLLISIHLAHAKERKLMMKNEYIIPITSTTRKIRLYPDESKRHGLPGVGLRTCLRPGFRFSTPCFVVTGEEHQKQSPEIPLEILKTKALSMLTEAVQHSGAHIRDPVGGSVEFQFVPVLKLIGTLLVMGVFDDDDVRQILLLIDSSVFGEHGAETEDGTEKEEVTQVEEKAVEAGEKASKEAPVKGLLQTRLPESVKLQVTQGSKVPALEKTWGGLQCSLQVRLGFSTQSKSGLEQRLGETVFAGRANF